jgi:glycosyltransferase involved in cell wall biosynthesis
MGRKIVISINTAWNIYNFRRGLIKALIEDGFEVLAIAPNDEYVGRLEGLGCRFINIDMDSNGTHPGRDLLLLAKYLKALRTERPLAYLGYTVKPNVYGSIAAHLLNIPVVNNIAGLGTAFIKQGMLAHIVRLLYRQSLRRSHTVFFQNEDDRRLFINTGLVKAERTGRLPGSGMDLTHYCPLPRAEAPERKFNFLVVSRMLRDKGIEEFVEAARRVRQHFPHVDFRLLGAIDPCNPNAVSEVRMKLWEEEGTISYLGKSDDVRPYLSEADCVVLPSYREGVPRSLLEAAAMECPIITSNAVGCKDVVDHGVNGFLCAVRDSADLARKMIDMLELPSQRRIEMGKAGRRKVAAEFAEKVVIQKYLEVLKEIEEAKMMSRTRVDAKPALHDK